MADLASKNPKAAWLLDEYYSTEKYADSALKYVLKHSRQRGYILPQAVRLETQPTVLMNAYAARDSAGMPFIYVNDGLPFFLLMFNYSLAQAAFKNAALGGRSMSATLFAIVTGYWPSEVDLLSEMEAMGELSQDEKYFISAWLPSQIFFVVAHEFAHHLIWRGPQDSPQVCTVRLLTGSEVDVYCPSPKDELRADRITFDIWDQLDATLSDGFQAFTAGGLGALFGYFRILEEYIEPDPSSSHVPLPAAYRYDRLKTWLTNTGRASSLQAMEETWAITEIMTKSCLEARDMLQKPVAAKGEDTLNEST